MIFVGYFWHKIKKKNHYVGIKLVTGHLRQRAGLKSRRGSLDPAPLTPEPAALVPFLGDCVPQIRMKMPTARRLREEDGESRPVCATRPDLKRKKKNKPFYLLQ